MPWSHSERAIFVRFRGGEKERAFDEIGIGEVGICGEGLVARVHSTVEGLGVVMHDAEFEIAGVAGSGAPAALVDASMASLFFFSFR